jgi:ring-1,2-phenylacetyl-CoA epoxidase subunit PaaE
MNEAKKVKIKLYGEETEILVEPNDSILQSAILNGLEPPFSCQISVCATCKAKLKQGKVSMDEREALTDEEIQNGWILTCQSHPLTDDVYIDYDEA